MPLTRRDMLRYSAPLLCGFLDGCGSSPAPSASVCLLTGFEPFGGLSENPSWETVKALEGRVITGRGAPSTGLRIAVARLPVVYDDIATVLRDAIAAHKPVAVISFGVGSEVVQIERVARNGYHPAKPPDNKGQPPPRKKIIPNGQDTLSTSLPVAAIVQALQAAHIGAGISDDAGGYLCNECFYRLMAIAASGPAVNIKRRGFVHVPQFGQPDPAGGTFTREKLQQAATIIVETVAKDL